MPLYALEVDIISLTANHLNEKRQKGYPLEVVSLSNLQLPVARPARPLTLLIVAFNKQSAPNNHNGACRLIAVIVLTIDKC